MADWKELTVGDLCDTVSDTYCRKDEEVILVNTSDVLEGKILNHECVENKNLKGQFKKTFKKDDILYSEIRPANKRYAYVDFEETERYIASTKLMVLRPKTDVVLPRFLFAFLSSSQVLAELQHLAETRSGTFPQITFSSELAPMPIAVPDFETQEKIVGLLSSIEGRIQNNNAINENLLQQALLLFKEQFSKTTSATQKPLYDFAVYINGASFKKNEYSNSGLPIIKIAELKNGITDSTQYFSGDKDPRYNVSNGDILFSWSGNPETSIDIFIWHLGPAILNQHTFNVKAYDNHKWFVYLMLKSFKTTFSHIASNKQTTGLGHVTASDLKRLTFPYDKEQITRFEAIVSPMMEQCYSNMTENTKLSKLRDTLLPKLMSGELEVSDLVL